MTPNKIYLCQWQDIPEGQSRGFQLSFAPDSPSVGVLAVKKASVLYAYQNLCPHAYIPLEWVPDDFLTMDASLIQCANHGALFTIEQGLCIAGPCAGQSLQALAVLRTGNALYISIPD